MNRATCEKATGVNHRLLSEAALLLPKNNLKQLQGKKPWRRTGGGNEHLHLCRKLQGSSGGHWAGPETSPEGTHSADSTVLSEHLHTCHTGLWGRLSPHSCPPQLLR